MPAWATSRPVPGGHGPQIPQHREIHNHDLPDRQPSGNRPQIHVNRRKTGMKLAIMQPYLFPYLGYFHLIHAVDSFVVFDDVNYIKGGWINRNYILSQGQRLLITLPVRAASQHRLINELEFAGREEKLLRTLRNCYSKAPQFDAVYPLIQDILLSSERNLARFLHDSLRRVCEYLDLNPRWHMSSALHKDPGLRGQAKILAICEELSATHYINAPSGQALYDRAAFNHRGIKLSFVQPRAVEYKQFSNAFAPNLSILDVIMFNDREQCNKMLGAYDLV